MDINSTESQNSKNFEKKIVIVVPVYNESGNITNLYKRLVDVMNELDTIKWSVLFVNDGSLDSSWENISYLSTEFNNVRGLNLSRNFGKELALTAGLENVQECDAVVCIDADLQHPPELIPEFINEWIEGSDIVTGHRAIVEDYSLLKRIGSKLFYALMKKFSELDVSPNTTDFRLIDWNVIKEFKKLHERRRIFRGLVDWLGFKKSYVSFEAPARQGGRPTYSFAKLTQLALNSFTSFSQTPLTLISFLGIAIMLCCALLILAMIFTQNWGGYTPMAYFMVLNTFMIGIILSMIGVLGLYIGHIHSEVLRRPLYIIKCDTDINQYE